jgi:hypothetical protein
LPKETKKYWKRKGLGSIKPTQKQLNSILKLKAVLDLGYAEQKVESSQYEEETRSNSMSFLHKQIRL